jgi:hypothetical protein
MARLTDTQISALGNFWSDIAYVAAHGGTVTDAVSVAAYHAGLFGETLSFEDSQAVAVLAGYAVRMENAASVFRGADLADPITADMIGTPPWARDQQVMNTSPIWHATFEMEFQDENGDIQTEFRTSVFEMTLPETVGELTADILDDAEAMAAKYEVTLLSVRPHSLHAV